MFIARSVGESFCFVHYVGDGFALLDVPDDTHRCHQLTPSTRNGESRRRSRVEATGRPKRSKSPCKHKCWRNSFTKDAHHHCAFRLRDDGCSHSCNLCDLTCRKISRLKSSSKPNPGLRIVSTQVCKFSGNLIEVVPQIPNAALRTETPAECRSQVVALTLRGG